MSKKKKPNRLYQVLLATMAIIMIISMIAAAVRF
jgi:hypothetical protein